MVPLGRGLHCEAFVGKKGKPLPDCILYLVADMTASRYARSKSVPLTAVKLDDNF